MDGKEVGLAIIDATPGESLPEEVLEVMLEQAFRYAREAGLSMRDESDRAVALAVVKKAFGVGSQGQEWPETGVKSFVSKAITHGLKDRQEMIERAGEYVSRISQLNDYTSHRRILAINREIVDEARGEIDAKSRLVDLPAIERFVAMVEAREKVVEEMAQRALAITLEVDLDDPLMERNQLVIEDSWKKAVAARGLLVFLMLRASGVRGEYKPLLFDHEHMISLLQLIDSGSIGLEQEPFEDQVFAERLVRAMGFGPELEEAARGLVLDYIGQVRGVMGRWAKSVGYKAGIDNYSDYWPAYFKILRELPIDPVALGRRFGFSKEGLKLALAKGDPHLWTHAVVIEDYMVPSPRDLALGLYIVEATEKFWPRGELSTTLKAALAIWQRQERVMTRSPEKIKTIEAKIAEIEPQILKSWAEVANFAEGKPLIPWEIASLRRDVARYSRALETDVWLRGLEMLEQLEPEAGITGQFIGVVIGALEDRQRRLGSLLERAASSISQPHWIDFIDFLQAEAGAGARPLVNLDEVERQLEAVNGVRRELAVDLTKSMPEVFAQHRDGLLVKFIDELMKRLETPGQQRRWAGLRNHLVGQEGEKALRQSFVKSFRYRAKALEKFLAIGKRLAETEENLAMARECLDDWQEGRVSADLLPRVSRVARVVLESRVGALHKTRAAVLPDELRDVGKLRGMQEAGVMRRARDLVDAYAVIPGIRFRFPKNMAELPGVVARVRDSRGIKGKADFEAGKMTYAGKVRRFLDLLLVEAQGEDSLVPWDKIGGRGGKTVMTIVEQRLNLAEALLDEGAKRARLSKLESLVADRQAREEQYKLWLRLRKAQASLERVKEEFWGIDEELLAVMKDYGLAIPVDEYEQMVAEVLEVLP